MARTWYRVYFRSRDLSFWGKAPRWRIVSGAAELERELRGAVFHHEVAALHQCHHCFRRGPWGKDWIGYPPCALKRDGRALEEVIYCSRACWVADTGGFELPEWMDLNREPGRSREANSALVDAISREVETRRDKIAYRKVPMPEPWPGEGTCKWCLLAIVNKAGQPTRRSWHEECVKIYFLHSRLPDQFAHLIKRDGRRCWDCKSERWELEVDHEIPLYSVRHLPPDERRAYYGPTNLRLRCGPCHKAKSKREAAERAAERAFAKAQPRFL